MEATQELQYALNTLWFVLRRTMGIRIGEAEEYEGGDIAECGMHAYPEFVSSTLIGEPGAAPDGAHATTHAAFRPDNAPA